MIAGITIAMIIIPQSMAYATLANLDPVYGLYAAFIPVAIAAFFGSSRYLATGPVAMVSLLTAVAITTLSSGDEALYVSLAIMLALSVGVFQIALSMVKAGKLIDIVLKEHVILGFTSAAALIIASSQLSKVFGLNTVTLNDLFNINRFLESTPINSYAVFMSLVALVILYVFKNKLTKYQFFGNIAVLSAVVITIIFSKSLSYDGPIVGAIPGGLPSFSLPEFGISPELIFMFIIHTIIISFVGFMEAIAIARQLEQKEPGKNSKGVELYKYPTPVNSNQELFGQGLGNIASSISGAYPVSGSFSRSAVNESVGSYSPISSITTMLIVMFTLLYATPLLFDLPKSTLGIIVIFAVVPLIRIKKMSNLFSNDKQKGIVSWITFFSTLIFPMLSIEIFSGVNTHIWTGIIFGFLLSLIIERKPSTA
ncbi:SulP family inorganic anion transporter [Gammaproteobacteria bacterium]|nr:SulP family inorganic anion transporter [Gammaproteobacteria bacterium]